LRYLLLLIGLRWLALARGLRVIQLICCREAREASVGTRWTRGLWEMRIEDKMG